MSNFTFDVENVLLPEIDFDKIKIWLRNCFEILKKEEGDLAFIFCSDNHLLGINKEYLNHDYFTDIITFDYSEKNILSGDIFISVDRVEENANNFNVNLENEFHRIIIHGILHLAGYNDKSDEERNEMTRLENFYLEVYS